MTRTRDDYDDYIDDARYVYHVFQFLDPVRIVKKMELSVLDSFVDKKDGRWHRLVLLNFFRRRSYVSQQQLHLIRGMGTYFISVMSPLSSWCLWCVCQSDQCGRMAYCVCVCVWGVFIMNVCIVVCVIIVITWPPGLSIYHLIVLIITIYLLHMHTCRRPGGDDQIGSAEGRQDGQ